MASEAQKSLLSADDPPPVRVTNRGGGSLFLLLGDHAGNLVPARLASLGLPPEEFNRHIAQDIGIAELGHSLARKLDAPFIEQRYSRLVVDCNRSKGFHDSIASVSDETAIPCNDQLSPDAANQRYIEIFEPYHGEIAHVIDERMSLGRSTVLVSLHSFTPILDGKARPWDIGVLYEGGDTRYARAVLGELRRARGWHIGDNEPYRMDETDFTIPRHAYAKAVPYVELEIRQDHLAKAERIERISKRLAGAIVRSAAIIEVI
jgi:predicted N-formylglutamate amidohydrolase